MTKLGLESICDFLYRKAQTHWAVSRVSVTVGSRILLGLVAEELQSRGHEAWALAAGEDHSLAYVMSLEMFSFLIHFELAVILNLSP